MQQHKEVHKQYIGWGTYHKYVPLALTLFIRSYLQKIIKTVARLISDISYAQYDKIQL